MVAFWDQEMAIARADPKVIPERTISLRMKAPCVVCVITCNEGRYQLPEDPPPEKLPPPPEKLLPPLENEPLLEDQPLEDPPAKPKFFVSFEVYPFFANHIFATMNMRT